MSSQPITSPPPGLLKRLAIAGVNLLTLLYAGLIITYFALRWLGGDDLWFIDALSYVLPWLFAPLAVLLPAVLLRRSRLLLILVAVPTTLFLLTYGQLYLPRWPVRTAGPTFIVMTHNVFNRNSDAGQIADVIRTHDPDFVGLRELSTPVAQALESRFAWRYPYRKVEPGLCGVLSRYPILDYQTFQLGDSWAPQQQFILDIDGYHVNVFSVHLHTPLQANSGSFSLSPNRYLNHLRDADVRDLLSRIEQVDGPLVVIGDFNLTDQQSMYAPLTRHLCDAHRESGWGMGFTFTRFPRLGLPVWRIDYVFHSPDLVALSTVVGDYGESDHRPVIARLAFRLP